MKKRQKKKAEGKERPKTQRKTTRTKKAEFLNQFSMNGNITKSAEYVGIERSSHYRWMKEDPEYRALYAEAEDQFADNLEAEARRRAFEGYEEDVYYQGDIVGQQRKFSDTLLIFLLKGAKPQKYKDRVEQETTHKGGLDLELRKLTTDELKDMLEAGEAIDEEKDD